MGKKERETKDKLTHLYKHMGVSWQWKLEIIPLKTGGLKCLQMGNEYPLCTWHLKKKDNHAHYNPLQRLAHVRYD